jgi:hypothetical protein
LSYGHTEEHEQQKSLAEDEGFEPSRRGSRAITDFKSGAFSHSANLPFFTTTNCGQGGRSRTYGLTHWVSKPNFALYQLSYTLLMVVRTARLELAAS